MMPRQLAHHRQRALAAVAAPITLAKGWTEDYKQAMYWYLKAAAQESVGAYVNIGYMYKHGQGVEKDYQAAFE